jgi:hypothetical protein
MESKNLNLTALISLIAVSYRVTQKEASEIYTKELDKFYEDNKILDRHLVNEGTELYPLWQKWYSDFQKRVMDYQRANPIEMEFEPYISVDFDNLKIIGVSTSYIFMEGEINEKEDENPKEIMVRIRKKEFRSTLNLWMKLKQMYTSNDELAGVGFTSSSNYIKVNDTAYFIDEKNNKRYESLYHLNELDTEMEHG